MIDSGLRRRRRRWAGSRTVGVYALLWGLVLVGQGQAADEKAAERPKLGSEGVYAMSVTRGESGLHIVEYWSRHGAFRAHTTLAGFPIVSIVSGDYYYTLDPVHRRGVAIKRSPRAIEQGKARERSFGNEYEDIVAAGGEKIRTEQSPAGQLDVYRTTDDMGRRTVWVTGDDHHLPLRYETFNRSSGKSAQLEYSNWTPIRLTDKFFQAPTPEMGWQIETVESYEDWLNADRGSDFRKAPTIFPLLLHGQR